MNDADRIAKAGGIVDITPGCFALKDGSILSWRGENYVPQKPSLLARFHNWRVRRWNKRHA
jgi:hypothetical protein